MTTLVVSAEGHNPMGLKRFRPQVAVDKDSLFFRFGFRSEFSEDFPEGSPMAGKFRAVPPDVWKILLGAIAKRAIGGMVQPLCAKHRHAAESL